jgi:hypothetical protein
MPQATHPLVPDVARKAMSAVPFSAWYVQCRLAPSTGSGLHLRYVRPPVNVAVRQFCAVAPPAARSSTRRGSHAGK